MSSNAALFLASSSSQLILLVRSLSYRPVQMEGVDVGGAVECLDMSPLHTSHKLPEYR